MTYYWVNLDLKFGFTKWALVNILQVPDGLKWCVPKTEFANTKFKIGWQACDQKRKFFLL